MIITGTNLIKGRLDLSSLERLYESNPVERYPFHATIIAGQSIQADDKFYTLHNIQTALNGGYIVITDYNAGGGGTSDHAALSNLDYASAGHTGFLPSTHLTDFNHSDIAHANRVALDAVSNVNTGDQDLSSYLQGGDNVSSLANDSGYLTAETDPVFAASSWYTTNNNSASWDSAFSWGNHASVGYLTEANAAGIYFTQSNADAHINDLTIHFTEGSIDHLNIQNVGNNSHSQIDQDLARLANTSGLNTGDQDLSGYLTEANAAGIYFTQSNADAHINDLTIHFTEGSIDHLNIQNVGNNTHSQIDQDLARLANTSGLNTGDQDLSTYLQIGDNVSSLVNDVGYITIANVSGDYLMLDQTNAQSVINGAPIFDAIDFNTGATPLANAEGRLQWNATDGTLDLGMSGGDIAQQIGQEMFIKVHNRSGVTIPNGSPVYVSGRQGNRPKIWLARSDSDTTSSVIGITTQAIDDQTDGYVTTFGYVRQIKTNYSGAGDWGTTWAEGDHLYVSKTIAGQLTNIEPTAPHHSDVVGEVAVLGGAGIGSIFVNIKHHKTLEELSDVDGTPLTTDGQLVVWSNTASVFDFNYNINNYLSTSNAASIYAKLDGTNQPFTGNLNISKANPRMTLTDSATNSPTVYLEKLTTNDGAQLVSQNRVFLSGNGLSLNGSGYANRSSVALGQVFSVEAWYKTSSTASQMIATGTGGADIHLWFSAATSVTVRSNSNAFAIWTVTYADNVWHHWAVTSNGTALTLYKDGVSQGTQFGATSVNRFFTNIGNFGADNGHKCVGIIDELVIWNKTLTAGEVTARYNGGAGAIVSDYTNVIAEYRLDNNYNDSSPNAYNCTAQGSGNSFTTAKVSSATQPLTGIPLLLINNNGTNLSYGDFTTGYYSGSYGTSNTYDGLTHAFRILGTTRAAISGSTFAVTGNITASTSIGASTTLTSGTTLYVGTQAQIRGGTGANDTTLLLGASGAASSLTTLGLIKTADAGGDWVFMAYHAGAGTSPKIHFGGYNATPVNGAKVSIDTLNGRLGIRTTSPSYSLDVSDGNVTAVFGADSSAVTRTNNSTKVSRIAGLHYTSSTEEPVLIFLHSSSSTDNIVGFGGGTSSCNTATILTFSTAANTTTTSGTERMRITSAGYVGIGITSPSDRLDVLEIINSTRYTNDAFGAYVRIRKSRNATVGTQTIVQNGDTVGYLVFDGSTGTAFSPVAGIRGEVDAVPSATSMPGRLVFTTGQSGSLTNLERMRIDSSGSLLVGTTSLLVGLGFGLTNTTQIEVKSKSATDGTKYSFADLMLTGDVPTAHASSVYNIIGRIIFANNAIAGTGSTEKRLAQIAVSTEANQNSGNLTFLTTSSGTIAERMRITSAGKIGIGTTAPDKMLEINSADGNNLRLTYNDADGTAANYVDFLVTATGDLTITPSGGDIDAGSSVIKTTGAVQGVHKAADGTNAVADGTYNFYNDGITSGQVTSFTIKDGIITSIAQIP